MKIEFPFVIVTTIVVLIVTHIYIFLYTPPSRESIVKNILIPQGASFSVVARELEKEGIIKAADNFYFLAKFKGALTRIKAGEYEFSTSLLPSEVLKRMLNGQIKEYAVTIPEGYNMKEIAVLLSNMKIVDKNEFIEKALDIPFAASLGIEGSSVEGFLFPDTYRLTRGMTAEEVIRKMIQRFDIVYAEIANKQQQGLNLFIQHPQKKGMTKKQIVILASIIEKETGNHNESPIISAVFHNRIKKSMRLESDPTVIYGIKDFEGNLTKKHLLTYTPYNTYKVYGLPPGPIANPGSASLDAAANPSSDIYLYFVSKNDGSHYFSKTLKEHNNAVYQYQKRFNKNNKLANRN